MTPEISVATVNYNSARFVENALYALQRLTTRQFEFLVCDNGSNFLDRRRLERLAANNDEVSVFWREQDEPPSEAHGTGLNRLVPEMSGEYGVFLDADATFLQNGWDDYLIERLSDDVKVVGTPPVENPIKPTDFPSLYATLFDADAFRELDIDMRPEDPSVGKDTGWEMREKFQSNGYESVTLEAKNTREFDDGPFGHMLCAEYYLDGVDGVFASHFGRGSSLGAAKYFKGGIFDLPKVGYVLGYIPSRLRGYREKREWLSVCESLVEDRQ